MMRLDSFLAAVDRKPVLLEPAYCKMLTILDASLLVAKKYYVVENKESIVLKQ